MTWAYPRRLVRYDSTVETGTRYEVWHRPDNNRAPYAIVKFRGTGTDYAMPFATEVAARKDFERRVVEHVEKEEIENENRNRKQAVGRPRSCDPSGQL